MANNLVLVSSDDEGRDGAFDQHDELGAELEAMGTIGRALDAIKDPALRQRILNWAVQRWGDDCSRTSPTPTISTTPVNDPTNDPALAVDSIGDLFAENLVPSRPVPAREPVAPAKPGAKAPVETMLQSLAADFQRLADEWNGA